jgi:hypothetical protein
MTTELVIKVLAQYLPISEDNNIKISFLTKDDIEGKNGMTPQRKIENFNIYHLVEILSKNIHKPKLFLKKLCTLNEKDAFDILENTFGLCKDKNFTKVNSNISSTSVLSIKGYLLQPNSNGIEGNVFINIFPEIKEVEFLKEDDNTFIFHPYSNFFYKAIELGYDLPQPLLKNLTLRECGLCQYI